MNEIEVKAREACKAKGLDPDEKVFVQVWDPSPDAEPVIHNGSNVILGVKRPQWKSFIKA